MITIRVWDRYGNEIFVRRIDQNAEPYGVSDIIGNLVDGGGLTIGNRNLDNWASIRIERKA